VVLQGTTPADWIWLPSSIVRPLLPWPFEFPWEHPERSEAPGTTEK